jgi:hypothetical protein
MKPAGIILKGIRFTTFPNRDATPQPVVVPGLPGIQVQQSHYVAARSKSVDELVGPHGELHLPTVLDHLSQWEEPCSISGKPLLWKESTPALATTNPELSCERSVVSGGFPTAEAIVGSQTLNQGQSHDPYRPGAGGRTRLDVGWRTEVA